MRETYTKLRYFSCFEKTLNLSKPSSFHEKLFWLSVRWRNPLIVRCADKYQVREYVKDCGCDDILNQLYGVYISGNEIDFDKLPERFVLKNNRGSGDNFFCLDKSTIDRDSIVEMVDSWRNNDYGVDTAEYQYYPIPFRIICEKYLLEPSASFCEYQLFCFNGEPHSFLVRTDLETNSGCDQFAVSYSLEWERLFLRKGEDSLLIELPEPKNRQKMIDYARILSKPFPHVRVDFYEVSGTLFFGELTFSSHGNLLCNYKDETLEEWGNCISLPEAYHGKDRY